MDYSSDTGIARIATGLIERTSRKSDWMHPAHLAAAAWVLSAPKLDTFSDIPVFIRAYNEATGIANTDSQGFMRLSQSLLRRPRNTRWMMRPTIGRYLKP